MPTVCYTTLAARLTGLRRGCVQVLNKVDQINEAQSHLLAEVCSSLNPKARAVTTEFGKVTCGEILRNLDEGDVSVADAFGDDEHAKAVQTVLEENKRKAAEAKAAAAHSHDHGHAHGRANAAAHESSRSHGHEQHGHAAPAAAGVGSAAHGDGHGHGHGSAQAEVAKPRARHMDRYGIGSFVYSRRRPFHPVKLSRVITQLPVSVNDALQLTSGADKGADTPAPASAAADATAAAADSGINRVIRSKGFSWLATYHTAALYWSHAGNHFELKNVGSWWAAVAPDQLPDGKVPDKVSGDFQGAWGDRRQEIIFIGRHLQEKKIVDALDACLLSDAEMEQYTKHWQGQRTS